MATQLTQHCIIAINRTILYAYPNQETSIYFEKDHSNESITESFKFRVRGVVGNTTKPSAPWAIQLQHYKPPKLRGVRSLQRIWLVVIAGVHINKFGGAQ